MELSNFEETDNFSPVFKYYKQKKAAPSLASVIGYPFFNASKDDLDEFEFQPTSNISSSFGVNTLKPWKILHINTIPGLYVVTNPFTNAGIKFWSRQCLDVYSKIPNKTNLDSSTLLKEEVNTIWNRSLPMINKNKGIFKSSHKGMYF